MGKAKENDGVLTSLEIKIGILAIVALSIIGCATGSTVLVGTARPAIEPDQVKLYFETPTSFEVIGLVEASSDSGWTAQGSMDYAIAELKNQAAKIGANGVLLNSTGSKSSGTVGFYSGGVWYGAPVEAKTVTGQAIFVY